MEERSHLLSLRDLIRETVNGRLHIVPFLLQCIIFDNKSKFCEEMRDVPVYHSWSICLALLYDITVSRNNTVTIKWILVCQIDKCIYVTIFVGYVFWSLFQGLGPMIWFYPLNELDISGYEAFAATWFSPILFGIPGVMSLVQNRWVLGVLRLLIVGSLASFQAPSTLSRLMILAGGAGVSMLVLAATLWSPDVKIRWVVYHIKLWIIYRPHHLELAVVLVSKYIKVF